MFVKGKSGNPAGKPKGTPNKISKSCKANIAAVFDRLGGEEGMLAWAQSDPGEFYKIYARMLPMEMGEDGGGITVVIRKFSDNE
jgi:hypothetical protein